MNQSTNESMTTKKVKRINWPVTIFLAICPFVALTGVIGGSFFWGIHGGTWLLSLIYTFLTGMGITVGYHRLFAHKTFKATKPVEMFWGFMGAATFQGSILEWSSDHRIHHQHIDTDKDPYSITKGFWFAHVGWLIGLDPKERDFKNVRDLQKKKWIQWQHDYYVPVAAVMGFLLPAAVASLWGDFWGGLLVAGAFRIFLNHHFTFSINSVCHTFGSRPYSEKISARDHWFTALFTYGEGYHNFHHQFPNDYRNGIRYFHYDPSKWTIWLMEKVGLVSNLKRARDAVIIRSQVALQREKVKATQVASEVNLRGTLTSMKEEWLTNLQYQIESALAKIDEVEKKRAELKNRYQAMKREKVENWQVMRKQMKHSLDNYKDTLDGRRRELKNYLGLWKKAVNLIEYSARC